MTPPGLIERYRSQAGDHSCVFYRDDDDLLRIVGPYFLQGLRQGNERCFAAQRESFLPKLIAYLEQNGIDVAAAIKSGRLELHSAEQIYRPNGIFDRVDMCARVQSEIRKTSEAGFAVLRAAGDVTWLDDPRTVKEILDYEQLLSKTTQGASAIIMCQYPLQQVPSALHEALMRDHNIRIRPLPNGRGYGYSLCNGEHIVELSADGDASRVDFTLSKLGAEGAIASGSEATFDDAIARARRSLFTVVGH